MSFKKPLNFGQYVPNDKVLNEKVPENPRYKHVKPAVDSGKNVKRQIDEFNEKYKSLSIKKGEVFSRIKISAFIKLAIYVAKEQLKEEDNEKKEETIKTYDVSKTSGQLANVLVGIGEIDLQTEKLKPSKSAAEMRKLVPYLLLDVRDKEEYLKSHITTAKHYPAAMLSRTNCYELEEMKLYKNSHPELIVLYDEDESISVRVATTLVQRGYDNIYVLSGGLKLGHEKLPPTFMAAILASNSKTTCQGPGGDVQFKDSSKECFTLENIERVQRYFEDFSYKNCAANNSKTSFGKSKGIQSTLSTCKSTGSINNNSNFGSLTYRKGTPPISKSAEPIRQRAENGFRSLAPSQLSVNSRGLAGETSTKKAPWK